MRRLLTVSVGLGVLVAGVSACGSGRSPAATTAKAPLAIMQMAPPSNPATGNIFDGTTVAAAAINARGGVDGHPIKVIDCDDGAPFSDPNDTAQCASQAVQDHVLAMVGNFSLFTSNIYASLQPASIANIGGLPSTSVDNTNPLSYPVQPDNTTTYAGIGLMLGRQKCKKVAFVGSQSEGNINAYAK